MTPRQGPMRKGPEPFSSPPHAAAAFQNSPSMIIGGKSYLISSRTLVMGILNTTPDSFSDGGLFQVHEAAVARGLAMIEEGADIIDIGGESTRPGSDPVSVEEELERVIPVIEELHRTTDTPISIDTSKARVADEACKAGAAMINDITGLRGDADMAAVAARHGVPVVIMHIKGTPRDMQREPYYESLIEEICAFLREGAELAMAAGVKRENIILDPGIGFGKTLAHNLEILARLGEIRAMEYPLLVGPSRKSFIGTLTGGLPPEQRVEGTAAAITACILNGADIVRVHDVREMARVAQVADAIKRAGR